LSAVDEHRDQARGIEFPDAGAQDRGLESRVVIGLRAGCAAKTGAVGSLRW
jgi:hypothetical protein